MSDYSYIGVGKVYIKDSDAETGLIEVGNCSKLEFSVEEDAIEQRDYTTMGGGVLNKVQRVKGVTATMTLHELKPGNIAIMLYGTASSAVAGSVTDEVLVAYQGGLVRTAHALTDAESVVVKNDNGGVAGSTTYDPVDDYEVRPEGLFIPAGSTIANGETVHVAYDHSGEDIIEALTNSAKEYQLVFGGLNEAQSGKPFIVDAHRVRFGASKAFSLIGDNFASFELTGSVLTDPTKTGTGISTFFKATSVQ